MSLIFKLLIFFVYSDIKIINKYFIYNFRKKEKILFFSLKKKKLNLNITNRNNKKKMNILNGSSLQVYFILSAIVVLSCLTGSSSAIKCYKCKGDDECDFKTRSIYIENCTWATKCWVCIHLSLF